MGKEFKPVGAEYNFECLICGSSAVEYRTIEDSDCHEDHQYHCLSCGRYWWVDGADY